jgi:agmatine/peptidylarginine deiminase
MVEKEKKIRIFPEYELIDTVVFAFRNQFFNTRFGYGKIIAELTNILSQHIKIEIYVTDKDKVYLDREMEKAGVDESAYERIKTCPSECILNSFMPIFGYNREGEIIGITFPFLPSDAAYETDLKQCEEYAKSYLNNRKIENIRMPFEFGATRIAANGNIALVSNCHENSETRKWFESNITQKCFFVPYIETEPTRDLDVFMLPLSENKWLLTKFDKARREQKTIDYVSQLLRDLKQDVIFIPGMEKVKHDDVDCLPNYANCLIANDIAIVPKYGRKEDETIVEVLSDMRFIPWKRPK